MVTQFVTIVIFLVTMVIFNIEVYPKYFLRIIIFIKEVFYEKIFRFIIV